MAAPVFRRLSSHLSRALPRPFSSIDNAPSLFPSFPQAGSVAVPTLPIHACGSMELMAVPKKKVSRHKKGLRNGPKALKPVPVIVRCKSCGRVRLPHFYCCSGDRESSGSSS